jgi:hypothetical protein
VLIVCVTPAVLQAETITFRNECRVPVAVQTGSVVGGVLRPDRTIVLKPREATPRISLDSDKIVIIYDARVPNRILYKDAVRASKRAIHVGIVPVGALPKVKLEERKPFPPGRTGGKPGMSGPGR